MPNLKFPLDESIAVPFGDGYYVVDDVIMDEDELKLYEHMKKLGINPSDRGKILDNKVKSWSPATYYKSGKCQDEVH